MASRLRALTLVRARPEPRQLQENRQAYYDALNAAQKGSGDVTAWLMWIAEQFAAACVRSERLIDEALEKVRFWSSHAGNGFSDRQRKALQKLLDADDGGFLGGLAAEKYCKITGVSKATATRDLSDMLQKGALTTRRIGKATK